MGRMKFYTRNHDCCKMKLILTYFGEKEKTAKLLCFVTAKIPKTNPIKCRKTNSRYSTTKPATLDDLNAILLEFSEKIQSAYLLLDLGKIKNVRF